MANQLEIDQQPISEKSLQQILLFLPYFSDENEFGKMVVDSNQFPYVIESDTVSKFIHTLLSTDFVVIFDWTDWDEGKDILINTNFGKTSKCNILKLRMLMTTIIRSNRFNEGYLLSQIKKGVIQKILLRLKQLVDNNSVLNPTQY